MSLKKPIILTVLILLLAACAQAELSLTAPTEPSATPTLAPTATAVLTPIPTPLAIEGLTVAFWYPYDQPERILAMEKLAADFNAANPYGLTVDVAAFPDLDTMAAAYDRAILRSEPRPNLLLAPAPYLASLYAHDQVIHLDEYISQSADKLSAAALLAGQSLEQQFAFPFSQTFTVLVYNQGLGRELGFREVPQTTAEFEAQVCAAAQEEGTLGFVTHSAAQSIMPWLYAFGEDGLATHRDGYDFTAGEVGEAFTFLRSLWQQECLTLVREDFSPRLDAPRVLVFAVDSAELDEQLMFYQIDEADEWTYLAFPAAGDKGVVGMQSQMLAVVDQTPEQNLAAWQFITFLTAPEAQAEWAAASGFLPVNADTDEILTAQTDLDAEWLSLLDFASLAQPDPNLPSWPIVQPAVEDALLAILWAEDQGDLNENLALLMDTITELVGEAR